jgi:hypothetical protein
MSKWITRIVGQVEGGVNPRDFEASVRPKEERKEKELGDVWKKIKKKAQGGSPGRLRFSHFRLELEDDFLEISVNNNPRHGIGFRAIIKGRPGIWGDSAHSPAEAVGRLFMNHCMKEVHLVQSGKRKGKEK